jgi:hypothetical protein
LVVGSAVLLALAAAAAVALQGSADRDLLAAAARGDAAVLRSLAGAGRNLNARDGEGRPALVLATRSRHPDAVRALLQAGADPNAADRSAWSSLHEAAELGDVETTRLLLAAGAAADLRSRVRGTPLDVAERAGRVEVAEMLRAGGAQGSGKSRGDSVCVRPWRGDGYCAVVTDVDPTRHRLRVSSIVGCDGGCAPDPDCSGGQAVGGAGGLAVGDELWVRTSCLTQTGLGSPP